MVTFLAFYGGLGLLAFTQNLRLQAGGGAAAVSSLAFVGGVAMARGNWTLAVVAAAAIIILIGTAVLIYQKPRKPEAGYDLPAVRFVAVTFAILFWMTVIWIVMSYAGLMPSSDEGIGGIAISIGTAVAAGIIALRVVVGRPQT